MPLGNSTAGHELCVRAGPAPSGGGAHQCEVLSLGDGFVFQQVHNIMANVPPENVIAIYDAVRECNARGSNR
jgi:uroporphyrinogen decarboxylase